MRKIQAVLCLAIFFPLCTSTAQAGAAVSGHLTMVYVPTSGAFVRFQLDASPVNPGNCGSTDGYIVEISPGTTTTNQFVSALLAAHLAGRSVTFWVDGCTTGQYWGATWPKAWDIYVYQ